MIKIVVVDDESGVFDIYNYRFRNQIRSNQYEFIFFEDGGDCYEYLSRDESHGVHLIFSDINMPGMDGLCLLNLLKETNAEIDVYLVSAYDNKEFRDLAAQRSANGYITKPVDFLHIESIIKETEKRVKSN